MDPPFHLFVKVNVDGSYKMNAMVMGFGGVICNQVRCWLGGFYCHRNEGDPLLTKLLAIEHGLNYTWDRVYKSVECKSDCVAVVEMISCSDENTMVMHQHALTIKYFI